MRLKIWHKMIIGISIPSLIVIFGGLLSYEYLNDVKKRQEFVQLADKLTQQVLEVRRNEKNFLLHKDAAYYKFFQDAADAAGNSANNISPEIVEEIGKEDFLQLRRSIQTYSGLIYELYVNYQKETDVVEKVREEGRKLETFVATKKHAEELSTSFILHLRLLEKNYMLFRDKNSFNKLDSTVSQIKNLVPFCIECTPYVKAVNNLFAAYSKNDLLINDLQVIGSKLEESTNKTAESERQKVNAFVSLTQRYLLLVLALLCISGPLIIYKTSSYIVAPIKRLAEITRKISEGNLTLRAPIREHDETYTLALSFNTMLDHLQLTHESLEKSLDLLRDKQAQLVESKKLASIGTLASGVAHELNNPLNNIYTTAQRLIKKSGQECPVFIKTGLADIFGQSMRVKKIVGDLLEFARGREPQLREVELNGLITGVYRQLGNSMDAENIKFTLDSRSEEIMINADPEQLEQVFINLFANAIDAMSGAGSLKVKIEAEKDSLRIIVSDTGPGMSRETAEKIFEPFFTTKDKGTGLGLAIIFNIIQKHSGQIIVGSEEGKGTTFIITLPGGQAAYRKNEYVISKSDID
ncbi:MAG: HAMP domain-containing protein [Nitrospirae bacterium]|nr:HAMP domain-containing protein [Nitrospirota bacterium]